MLRSTLHIAVSGSKRSLPRWSRQQRHRLEPRRQRDSVRIARCKVELSNEQSNRGRGINSHTKNSAKVSAQQLRRTRLASHAHVSHASVNMQVRHARCIRSLALADDHGAHSPRPQLCQFGLVPGRLSQMRGCILKLGVAVCSHRHASKGRVASELPPRDRSTKRRL